MQIWFVTLLCFSFKWLNRTSVLVVPFGPLKSFYLVVPFGPILLIWLNFFLIGGSIWPISFLLFSLLRYFISFRLYSCTDILTKLQNHYPFEMFSSIFFFTSLI